MTVATDQSAPATVIRYRNLGGAIVAVTETDPRSSAPASRYLGRCTGCLESVASPLYPSDLDRARTWAAKHAVTCHALPQAADEAQSVSAVYLGVAHELIERARVLSDRGRNAADGQRAAVLGTVARSVTAFALAAHQIEGATV